MKPSYPPHDRNASRSETFKNATGAAVKALAGKPDTTVVFTPVANQRATVVSNAAGHEVRLPLPPHKLSKDHVTRLRGAADAAAMRLKHHDTGVHARRMPSNKDAVDAYNAMEQARVEALGARQFDGVGHNLGAALEQRLAAEGYHMARTYAQIDRAEALKVLVHARANALALGATGKHIENILRGEFGTTLDKDLGDLVTHLADQKKSADILRRLIEDMNLEKDDVKEVEREEDEGDDDHHEKR